MRSKISISMKCEQLGITREEYNYTRNSHKSMIDRCTRTKSTSYFKYGAKGIKVCDRWLDSFVLFVVDMGVRPPDNTIDRIDGSKGYFKENCQWASYATQNNNKLNNHKIVHEGTEYTASQLSGISGISEATIRHRHNNGRNVFETIRKTKESQ